MDKTKIEFLIRNGFTLDEIMKLEPESSEPVKEPEPVKNVEPVKTQEPEKTVETMLESLKQEIFELRSNLHAQNRAQNVIENPPKQLTFEEDIEKMIEEVTK